jgi:hypothetical protein
MWLLKKSVFLKKVENRVIENVQETGKNRLQSFLTRSNFCKFRVSEFFNSHSSSHHLSHFEIVGDNPCSQQLSLPISSDWVYKFA